MTYSRRQLLAAGSVTLAGALSGCLDAVAAGSVEFASTPARVSADALESSGFSEDRIDEEVVVESVSALGVSREVRVTNWVSEYTRSLSLLGTTVADLAVFAAITTPQVRVLGREFNYVSEFSSADLAAEIQHRYDDVRNVEQEDEYSLSILDSEATVGRFRADAEFLSTGQTLEVDLHVTDPIEHDEEYVACIGVYPRRVSGGDDRIATLMEGVAFDE
ncbi:DUF6517 family protein [Natrononativus amylolyticus]|uniref:DUF6517 family protein n=1 Tax=Natrononativus amylolyticus TaxID=2963434 RepID=UPI0020CF2E01|nr:DUF6517 family protein [Natrononativus amylolyticus]